MVTIGDQMRIYTTLFQLQHLHHNGVFHVLFSRLISHFHDFITTIEHAMYQGINWLNLNCFLFFVAMVIGDLYDMICKLHCAWEAIDPFFVIHCVMYCALDLSTYVNNIVEHFVWSSNCTYSDMTWFKSQLLGINIREDHFCELKLKKLGISVLFELRTIWYE